MQEERHQRRRRPHRRPHCRDPVTAAGQIDLPLQVRFPALYGLITHPEHRKKIPQTLSGFFHPSYRFWLDNEDLKILPGFVGIMESEELPFLDSSLPFLTGYRLIVPKVCCNGLLFCFCRKVSPVMKPILLYAILQQRNGLS